MHSSQGNATAIGGATGSLILLRGGVGSRAEIHNLCLDCHSDQGSQKSTSFSESSTPPKVHFDGKSGGGPTGLSDPANFKLLGAGGDFSEVFTYTGVGTFTLGTGDTSTNYSLGHGHSVGATSVVPPGADSDTTMNFSCTNCHDPHGVDSTGNGINVYRNLKQSPVGGGGGTNSDSTGTVTLLISTPWGAASTGDDFTGNNAGTTNHYWPIFDGTSSNVYSSGTDGSATAGISGWCAQCHDNWHEDAIATETSGSDWRRHPVHNAIVDGDSISGVGVVVVNWTHYTERADSNAPYTNTAGTKLPAAQTASDTVYYADDTHDKVFCLSCHYAHGGPNYDALRWSYTSSVDDTGQGGNTIASNVGCQQCHNR
jgi:hypothetical protein